MKRTSKKAVASTTGKTRKSGGLVVLKGGRAEDQTERPNHPDSSELLTNRQADELIESLVALTRAGFLKWEPFCGGYRVSSTIVLDEYEIDEKTTNYIEFHTEGADSKERDEICDENGTPLGFPLYRIPAHKLFAEAIEQNAK